MQQGDDAMLLHFIDTIFINDLPGKIAVAVSGGGDSMALLHLYIRWSEQTGVPVIAATLDHGLRVEAADEAAFVATFCAKHGVPHTVLKWDGSQAKGNVQAAARTARYALIAEWALGNGTDAVVLGHTADDVAETFLMRLARKSGVEGLAAMSARFDRNGVRWARPLWQQTRTGLRDYLRRNDVAWIEDPTNEDLTQTRPKARKILKALAPLGIDVEGLTTTACALAAADGAIRSYAFREAQRVVTVDRGDVMIPLRPRPPLDPEIERRLMLAAIRFVAGPGYPPRESALMNLDVALMTQERHTVAGCLIMKTKDTLRIIRELSAARGPVLWTNRTVGQIWDARWLITEDGDKNTAGDLTIRALGANVKDVPDWRNVGLPRASLMASPAVFDNETLISAPVAGLQNGFSARIVADFHSFLLSR